MKVLTVFVIIMSACLISSTAMAEEELSQELQETYELINAAIYGESATDDSPLSQIIASTFSFEEHWNTLTSDQKILLVSKQIEESLRKVITKHAALIVAHNTLTGDAVGISFSKNNVIVGIIRGFPAEGKLKKEDIILAVNEEVIKEGTVLQKLFRNAKGIIKIKVARDGQPVDVELTKAKAPKELVEAVNEATMHGLERANSLRTGLNMLKSQLLHNSDLKDEKKLEEMFRQAYDLGIQSAYITTEVDELIKQHLVD
ncbi:hypothetical protein ACFLY5_00750 [Patescibacteria group bacterium]